VDWARLRVPGGARLRQRVVARCGPGSDFARHGAKFGDWVERGREAPATTVSQIELLIVQYLDRAAQTGRRWGTAFGVVFGLAGALAILTIALLWTVLR
jgi:hypothetical protein